MYGYLKFSVCFDMCDFSRYIEHKLLIDALGTPRVQSDIFWFITKVSWYRETGRDTGGDSRFVFWAKIETILMSGHREYRREYIYQTIRWRRCLEVYKYTSIQVHKNTSIQVQKYTTTQVQKYKSIQVKKYKNIQEQKYTSIGENISTRRSDGDGVWRWN